MTLTKEQLIEQATHNLRLMKYQSDEQTCNEAFMADLELMKIALASLEAPPLAYRHRSGQVVTREECCSDEVFAICCKVETPLYAAQPAPVSVPETLPCPVLLEPGMRFGKGVRTQTMLDALQRRAEYYAELEAMTPAQRAKHEAGMKEFAAMLQGAAGNSPAIPDDVRRMDWLVSKTVDVREPMVYGSHSLFWSQTITDEEDDYHATKLREQIDAAMAAENAAAPQQEAK